MTLRYTKTALEAMNTLPAPIRRAFYKQAAFLVYNLQHPSLHAKKYDEGENKWQARVNRSWRFYFKIVGDAYIIEDIIPHPSELKNVFSCASRGNDRAWSLHGG